MMRIKLLLPVIFFLFAAYYVTAGYCDRFYGDNAILCEDFTDGSFAIPSSWIIDDPLGISFTDQGLLFNLTDGLTYTSYIQSNNISIVTNCSHTLNVTGDPLIVAADFPIVYGSYKNGYAFVYYLEPARVDVGADIDDGGIAYNVNSTYLAERYYSDKLYFSAPNPDLRNVTWYRDGTLINRDIYTKSGLWSQRIGIKKNTDYGNMTCKFLKIYYGDVEPSFVPSSIGNLNINIRYDNTKNLIIGPTFNIQIIGDAASYQLTTDTGIAQANISYSGFYTIKYFNNEFSTRYYYVNIINTTNNTINLYDMNETVTNNISVQLYDEIGTQLPNAFIKVMRYNPTNNTYSITEIARSDNSGKTVLNLQLYNQFYKFIIEYPFGITKQTTIPAVINDNSLVFQINVGPTVAEKYFQSNSISSSLTFTNVTNQFRFSYNDGANLIYRGCLEVYDLSPKEETFINSTCTESSSAILYIGVINSSGKTYSGKGYVQYSVDGSKYYLKSLVYTYPTSNVFGAVGLFITFMLCCVFAFIGSYNKSVALIMTGLPIIFGSAINLIAINISIAIGIEILLFILAVMVGGAD